MFFNNDPCTVLHIPQGNKPVSQQQAIDAAIALSQAKEQWFVWTQTELVDLAKKKGLL